MGNINTGDRWDENPFIFYEFGEDIVDTQERREMPNPLRALYEDVAPLLLRSPPSERYPQEPTGRKEWDILTDPLSELIVTSAVPDPVIGLTLQRMMRPTIEGKEGLATHLNILCDSSGSMRGSNPLKPGLIYGYDKRGYGFDGANVACVVAAMMIAQAAIAKDTFGVWEFDSGANVVWAGPSNAHKAAEDWFLASHEDSSRPFYPDGGTQLGAGLNEVHKDMAAYDFDQAVTVVVTDGQFTKDTAQSMLFQSGGNGDEPLRNMGPVFYVILGTSYAEDDLEKSVTAFREVLAEHYKKDMSGCVLSFALVMGEDGNFADFAGDLVDMARVNSGDSDLKPCPRI
jgi:hypothetical protein